MLIALIGPHIRIRSFSETPGSNRAFAPSTLFQERAMLNLFAKDHNISAKHRLALLAFLLGLSGCAAPPPPDQQVSVAGAVGTPFLIALKVPACVATVLVAGPAAALQQLAAPNEDGLQPDIRPALDAGVDENCGPPYVVAPR
jgi:hypothetical protein